MNDKLKRLQKHHDKLKSQLEDKIPVKHIGRPVEYKRFLNNEIRFVKSQIDQLKGA
jgi:hypothetical protein